MLWGTIGIVVMVSAYTILTSPGTFGLPIAGQVREVTPVAQLPTWNWLWRRCYQQFGGDAHTKVSEMVLRTSTSLLVAW